MSNCVFSNLAVDNFAGLLNFHLLQYPLPRNATLFGNISHFQCSMLKNVDAYVPFAKYAYVIVRMVVVVVVELPLLLLEMCCVRYNTTISTRDKWRSIHKHLWVFNTTDTLQHRQRQQQPQIILILSLIHSFCLHLHLFSHFAHPLILGIPGIPLQFFCQLSPLRRCSMHDYGIVFFYDFILASYCVLVQALLYYMCICIFFYFLPISVCVCVRSLLWLLFFIVVGAILFQQGNAIKAAKLL